MDKPLDWDERKRMQDFLYSKGYLPSKRQLIELMDEFGLTAEFYKKEQ